MSKIKQPGSNIMCLAVPMKIITIEGFSAIVEVDGVSREINLRLLEEATIGDYVLVHAGFAIEKIDEEEARETLKLMQQIAALQGEDEVR
jgi:hydrogenase expression/formation protein HypC